MKKNTTEFVLDTYALFVYLNKEKGFEYVVKLLKTAEEGKVKLYFSTINLGELYYVLIREIGDIKAKNIIQQIQSLPVKLIDPDMACVMQAGQIKALGGISYADSYAIALAQHHDAILVTGDREFKKFANLVTIKWI